MMIRNKKPLCHNHANCKQEAISLVNGMWLCGECIIKIQKKIKAAKEKLLIEEGYQ